MIQKILLPPQLNLAIKYLSYKFIRGGKGFHKIIPITSIKKEVIGINELSRVGEC